MSWLKPAYISLWYRRFILGELRFAEGAVYDMFDDRTHVVDILPPMSDWLCVNVDYGTTNPLSALLLGLGVDGTLYAVAEWRWDSRQEGRQMTDRQYSMALRDWLNTVRLPASNCSAPNRGSWSSARPRAHSRCSCSKTAGHPSTA